MYIICIGSYNSGTPRYFITANTLKDVHVKMRAKGYTKRNHPMKWFVKAYYEKDSAGLWARVVKENEIPEE